MPPTHPQPHPIAHHPALADLRGCDALVTPDMEVNFLGIRARRAFFKPTFADAPAAPRHEHVGLPPFDENYFEWVALLDTIRNTPHRFTFVELGAGYGRWCVNAAAFCRRYGLPAPRLVAVEAEPGHCAMLHQHFADNGFEPRAYTLVQAAAAARDGEARFITGHADEWFGQAVIPRATWHSRDFPHAQIRTVPAVSLATLLQPLRRADLVDLDVQGAELDVLVAARDVLASKAARVFVGTHSAEIEAGLRDLFTSLRWHCVWDFAGMGERQTPFGIVPLGDGVQYWLNPALVPAAAALPVAAAAAA